jgi:hypothetical protein
MEGDYVKHPPAAQRCRYRPYILLKGQIMALCLSVRGCTGHGEVWRPSLHRVGS